MEKAWEQAPGRFCWPWGAKEEDIFLGTLNAGHPGGMFPLTEAEKDTLHSAKLPENLYIADATLIPKAMGNPPILTIMALSKRIAGKIKAGSCMANVVPLR